MRLGLVWCVYRGTDVVAYGLLLLITPESAISSHHAAPLSPAAARSHVKAGRGDQVCFLWEGNEMGDDATMTYKEVREAA